MIRAVVDPSVLVSAFIGNAEAGPGRLVQAWRDRRFVLVVSPMLLAELGEVLSRPKFARWASDGRGAAYVAALGARSEHHPDPDEQPPVVRDSDDDYLVALMRATEVDLLVSLDNDLLDAELADIAVVDPAVFVGRVEGAEKAKHFFTGTTHAGRELRLFYERPPSDETGQPVPNPAETKITGTLDGSPIKIFSVTGSTSQTPGSSIAVSTDQGTFTAIAGDDAETATHSEALRLYLEWRPSGGWKTQVEHSTFVEDEWRFTVSITNDRVSEHIEVRMSDAVAKSERWQGGADERSLEDLVAEDVQVKFRGATWASIQEAAKNPTIVLWDANGPKSPLDAESHRSNDHAARDHPYIDETEREPLLRDRIKTMPPERFERLVYELAHREDSRVERLEPPDAAQTRSCPTGRATPSESGRLSATRKSSTGESARNRWPTRSNDGSRGA